MHVKTIFSYSHKDAVYQFLASNSQFQLLRFSKNFFMMAVTLTAVFAWFCMHFVSAQYCIYL